MIEAGRLSAAALAGAIVDESAEPPFMIGMINPATGLPDPAVLGGPTTASSSLQNHVTPAAIPEPSTLLLLGTGLAGLVGLGMRRRHAKQE